MIEVISTEYSREIILSQNMTIQNAAELKNNIINELPAGEIKVTIGDDFNADISIIQLLYSAAITAVSMNRSLIFIDDEKNTLKDILETSGFLYQTHLKIYRENQEK